MFTRIVVGTDGSETAGEAVRQAVDLAKLTGAPASLARSLGFHDLMKGTATKPAPMAPTTAVVAVRKRRRPWLTGSPPDSLAAA